MGTEGLFLKSKYIYIIYKLPAVSGPFSWGGGEHSSGGRVLETDPAVCAHAMGVCVHAVERCVRVCVVHGGGAGSLLSPPGLSGAGGCWQGLVGGGVSLEMVQGAEMPGSPLPLAPPPPSSPRLPILLSPFPHRCHGRGGGRGVVPLPRPVPVLAARCSTAPLPGEGSTALGKGPSTGPGSG